ncbi:hypothetical protein NDU88_006425 [Pleurodeles waltl]|uniref:Uncharacterized protein n=1 Tax=Pleurodeles waltl TaxID=8319 RepID=A0AAV7PID7_PLEWA|nr:hypothetical protein NDU88_006425 [Pleurodeles waltl]
MKTGYAFQFFSGGTGPSPIKQLKDHVSACCGSPNRTAGDRTLNTMTELNNMGGPVHARGEVLPDHGEGSRNCLEEAEDELPHDPETWTKDWPQLRRVVATQ